MRTYFFNLNSLYVKDKDIYHFMISHGQVFLGQVLKVQEKSSGCGWPSARASLYRTGGTGYHIFLKSKDSSLVLLTLRNRLLPT